MRRSTTGINLMDLFMPGEEVRSNIGRALAGRRDRMMIQGHICSVDLNRQYDISRDLATCRKYFETCALPEHRLHRLRDALFHRLRRGFQQRL